MVSVIVPAYNAQRTVGKCLEALCAQDYPKDCYEIIVVDDGSADSTAEIIRRYPAKYMRQANSGPATARNAGAFASRGEVILFTDSDCVPDRNWISEMVCPFEDPAVAAVKGAYRTEQKSVVARFAQLEFEERFEMLKKAASIDMVDTYSAGFRSSLFREMGGFDTSFPEANNEDTELSYRFAKAGHRMVFNPRAIVCHLNHPDSLRRYSRLKFWRGYWRMVVYKRFPGKMIKDTYTPITLKFEILCQMLFLALLPFTLAFPRYGVYALLLIIAVFIALITPFTLSALRKDAFTGLFTPFLLFVRGASLGFGSIYGVLRRGL